MFRLLAFIVSNEKPRTAGAAALRVLAVVCGSVKATPQECRIFRGSAVIPRPRAR